MVINMAKTTKKIRLVRQNNADPVNGNSPLDSETVNAVIVNAPKLEKQYFYDVPRAEGDDVVDAYNTLLVRYMNMLLELDAAGIIELTE